MFFSNGQGSGSGVPRSSAVSILGPTLLSPHYLNEFAKSYNPEAIELGGLYVLYGEDYGIRGDVAFAQALLETGYFSFGGDVRCDQYNFAGIGATGGASIRGAKFASPEEGVLAHLQHLFAYASTAALPSSNPQVDPRFTFVSRGSAVVWTDLNGKWAVPGANYGQSILSLYGRMLDFVIGDLQVVRRRV